MFVDELWRRAMMFLRIGRFREEINEELQSHLAMKEADLRAAGMLRDEAAYAAQVRLGNSSLLREKSEDAWGWTIFEALFQDLRYAVRILRKNPLFTVAAMLILALGIGANSAIFSLINAILLRTMPVRDPNSLVEIARFWAGHQRTTLSYPLYSLFRDQSHSFVGMLAQSTPSKTEIDISGAAETVETQMVSGSYYEVLGVSAAAGHLWTTESDREPGTSPFAVISYRFWQRRFGLNPSAIGKTFRLHHAVFTIVGVTPRDFFGTMPGHDPDVTFPLSMDAQVNAELNNGKSWLNDPQTNWLAVIGRLKAGVSRNQAEAELRVLFQARNRVDAGRTKDSRYQSALLAQELYLEPAGAGLDSLRVKFSEPLIYLLWMVGLVLLLACMNLSSLLVGRNLARLREISVRMAVGAGRGRLVRQFLAESLVLGLAGGVVGLAVAQIFCRFLVTFMANGEVLFLSVQPDLRVLAFTGAISLATTLVVGLAPALYATRLNVTPGLKQVRSGDRQNLAKSLIVAQIAISLLLLVGTGLFVRTLINLRTLDAGFRPDGVFVFSIDSDKAGYKGERLRSLETTVRNRLQRLPGVDSASLSLIRILSGGGWNGDVEVEGYTYRQQENNLANFNEVGPQYFRTMGTPVLVGREFNERDLPGSPKVVIVNEAFARYYFGNRSPLGKHVKHVENAIIIGVVKDVKYQNLKEAFPRTVYFPALQDASPPPWSSYLVRVHAGAVTQVMHSIQQTIRQIDPALHITEPTTLTQIVDKSILNERILAMLSAFFGAVAVMLACVGVFGVMASYVARRTNEFGIRLALGAQRKDVLGTVLFEVATVIVAGIVFGLIAAVSVAGLARGLLFGLKPIDPFTFATATLVLVAAAFLAGYVPALRAANVDPTEALRAE